MKIGPKYKIARRLGPGIFEKTQSQKFALRANAKKDIRKKKRGGSDFATQLLEKQKARLTYGLNERQFKGLITKILAKKTKNMNDSLIESLESRLDNAVFRLGFAPTRQAARQMVSHGHFSVNGKKQTIPSYQVSLGDVISMRERSLKKTFSNMEERMKEQKVPSWLAFNFEKKEAKVQGLPKISANELNFDVSGIFQFYSK